ncbi:Gluconolactonase precursor [Anatilimnocola aggregata]|uniref:Gluconolactonase n=1 Tax=Anatilimnocola aggregata TaxID=2528021 RepID=A0A517YGG8_9BACT|nr:SMP-30/gluconolactonase/LRE family protein [Anatilimnocola aggregata]QDU29324.1 Gluconolactonase precursor [Anatilimnocola aggregata]
MKLSLVSLPTCCWLLALTTGRAQEPTGELADKLAKVTFKKYAAAPGYSEGPTWRNGEVFFCSGALLRVDAKQQVHKYLEINPAGTILNPRTGSLFVADNKHKAILEVTENGSVVVLAEQHETQPLRGLNDLTLDGAGNFYWSDPEGSSAANPVGNIYRLSADGRVDRVAGGLAFPNGLDVDPASNFLYVIESQSKKILRYPLTPAGKLLGKSEVFYDLGGSGGDGCAFDAAGNLWVADFHRPESGQGRITVLSPEAKALAYLPVPAKVVSNIAFCGPNHDEIFCTTGDPPGVFHAKVGVKGFGGHLPAKHAAIRSLDVVPLQPHADAKILLDMLKLAGAFKYNSEELTIQARDARLAQLSRLAAEIKDEQLHGEVYRHLGELDQAAANHASDLELIAEIKRLGGKVKSEVVAPQWLRAITGDGALTIFQRIVEIDLNERTDGHKEPTPKKLTDRVTDEFLQNIGQQRLLRNLQLSGTAVTSAGLVHLGTLPNLEKLNLCLTAVSDEGFEHLGKLRKMKRMTVCASKITGSGFKYLTRLKQLESINLHSSPASDEGLKAIGQFPSLTRLEIVHTNVTDEGLRQLAGLKNLRQLHIHGPKTTSEALPFLGELNELYELDVYDQAASDATLQQVAQLPKLRKLMLINGNFSDEGVKQLVTINTLENVTLISPNMTDASLSVLADLKNLRTLDLRGGKFSEDAKQKLQAILPDVQIKY